MTTELTAERIERWERLCEAGVVCRPQFLSYHKTMRRWQTGHWCGTVLRGQWICDEGAEAMIRDTLQTRADEDGWRFLRNVDNRPGFFVCRETKACYYGTLGDKLDCLLAVCESLSAAEAEAGVSQ